MVSDVMARRDGRPLLLIDIAVPRDVDPDVREIDGVHLYDIDDLQSRLRRRTCGRAEGGGGRRGDSRGGGRRASSTGRARWTSCRPSPPSAGRPRRCGRAELAKTLSHLPDSDGRGEGAHRGPVHRHRQEDPPPSHRPPQVEGVRPSLRAGRPRALRDRRRGRQTPDVPARRTIRVGTRGSRLARRQTDAVVAALKQRYPDWRFEVRTLRTTGDRRTREPLDQIGGVGVFVKELESALLAGEIDMAVHSLKDVPTAVPEGLTIAAVTGPRRPPRRPRQPERSEAGGASAGGPRRHGQPAARLSVARPPPRPGSRGHSGQRRHAPARKVEAGEVEAVVMAAAALARMGWLDRAAEILPTI